MMTDQVVIQDADTPSTVATTVQMSDLVCEYEKQVQAHFLTVAPCAPRKCLSHLIDLIGLAVKANTTVVLRTLPNAYGIPVREWTTSHQPLLQTLVQEMAGRLEPALRNYLVSPQGEKRTSHVLDVMLSDTHIVRLIRR